MSVLDRFFDPRDPSDLIAVQRALMGGEGDDCSHGCVKSIELFHRWSGSGDGQRGTAFFARRS